MRRAFATLLLLLCATCYASAQAAEGIKYTSPEGRYSVRLPEEPKLSAKDVTNTAGMKGRQFFASASDGTSLHMVLYFDIDAGTLYSFDKARDAVLSRPGRTLVSERAISLGDYAGKELHVLSRGADGREVSMRVRYYEVGRRIYALQCNTPKPADGPGVTAKCERFFGSFEVEAAK